MEDPVMGAEDFAYFENNIPSFSSLLEWMTSKLENENMLSQSKVILGWKVFN